MILLLQRNHMTDERIVTAAVNLLGHIAWLRMPGTRTNAIIVRNTLSPRVKCPPNSIQHASGPLIKLSQTLAPRGQFPLSLSPDAIHVIIISKTAKQGTTTLSRLATEI